MRIPFVDLQRKQLQERQLIERAVQQVLTEGVFVGGHQPAGFEKAFAHYTGTTHAIGCGNGTDALELMLQAAGIGAGDEVIVPAMSWIATASAVVRIGAQPVFADVEETCYTLDPERVSSLIHAKTKAVLPVHLYGQLAHMPALQEITDKNGLMLFEDAAQAHGAALLGKKAGCWGKAAAFSFYPTKNLGALGDAGAVLTADEAYAEKIRLLGNHGQRTKHRHELAGRNSRMDSLQAAILMAKLPLLDEWNGERRELARLYNEQLAPIPQVQTPQEREGALHVYHLYVIRCGEREGLQQFLLEKGVETALHYPQALSHLSIFKQLKGAGRCPVAESVSREILSLPLYPRLLPEEVEYVCEAIKEFYR